MQEGWALPQMGPKGRCAGFSVPQFPHLQMHHPLGLALLGVLEGADHGTAVSMGLGTALGVGLYTTGVALSLILHQN